MDFILSRQAALLSPSTIEFYKFTAGFFVDYIVSQSIFEPKQITSIIVRVYLSNVANRGVSSSTVHAHARGYRAFLHSLNEEGYISTPINMKIPSVEQKQMRVLSPDKLKQIPKVCKKP